MDPANSKASDFERRASRRVSRRVSLHAGGDGADDDDSNRVADGYRPSDRDLASDTPTPPTASSSSASSSSLSPHDAIPLAPRTAVANRPSSIAKPPVENDSIPSQHDGAIGPINQAFLSRQSSSASTNENPEVPDERPYDGPSGPSFPYQMYPQNVRVARTMSVTTASTSSPQDPSYTGPRGPAFPYGLYPQVAFAGPGGLPMPSIPVGFPGMHDTYNRQIGPEGDGPCMVGPHGHTEELPPYSRYPDEAYARKPAQEALSSEAAAPATENSSGPVAPTNTVAAGISPASVRPQSPETSAAAISTIPGAGGIGLAARNPEFDGTDPDSPQSRHTSRSFTSASSEASQHEINTAARAVSEKRKPAKKWQLFARRRLWGIVPYWAICLLITALLLMGIVFGAVLGSFLTKHKKPPRMNDGSSESAPAVTVTVDATPIPTPTDLPPLPTGTFGLPLMPNKSPNSCFNDTTQAQAWSCSIWFGAGMTLSINSNPPTQDGAMYSLSVNCNQSVTMGNNVFYYGEQPPIIANPVPLQLVNDTLDPNRGPAWFKMMPYNKTVIVPESLLTLPSPTPGPPVRRWRTGQSYGAPGSGEFHRKGTAQPGDKPWVCTWPDTLLEVFIYPNQNTSWAKISLGSSSSPAPGQPTPAPTPTPVDKGAVSGPPPSTPPDTAATPTTTYNVVPPPPPYPKVIKVEERRMARSRQATCVQYQIKNDGPNLKSEQIFDPNGNPIMITIVEAEPPAPVGVPPPPPPPPRRAVRREMMYERELYESQLFRREGAELSDCGCLWMLT